MWLDRETGAKCYMLSARALQISWGDSPQYWSWIPLADSRFVLNHISLPPFFTYVAILSCTLFSRIGWMARQIVINR
jgi:hypothetical protein